jgi:hypothetical protein
VCVCVLTCCMCVCSSHQSISPSASPVSAAVPPSSAVPSTSLFSYGSWAARNHMFTNPPPTSASAPSTSPSAPSPGYSKPKPKPKPKPVPWLEAVHRKPLFKNPEGLTLMISAYNINEHGSCIPRPKYDARCVRWVVFVL